LFSQFLVTTAWHILALWMNDMGGKTRNPYKIIFGSMKGEDHLRDQSFGNGRIILKYNLKK
jgi:hypothetical protein